MGDKKSSYRLKRVYPTAETQGGHATTRLQIASAVVNVGEVVELTDSEANKVRRFAELELVDKSGSVNLIDQPPRRTGGAKTTPPKEA
jgi:hypothetical protein